MQLARGDKNLHVLRGVRSPTLVIGVPCPTLILVNYVRGVRSPRWEIFGFCILSFCQNERI